MAVTQGNSLPVGKALTLLLYRLAVVQGPSGQGPNPSRHLGMTMSTTAPINGEILVETPSPGDKAGAPRTTAEDAEFIDLDDDGAHPTANIVSEAPAVAPQAAAVPDGLGILRPERDGSVRKGGRAGQAGFAALLVAGVCATFWFSGGYALVGKPAAMTRHAALPSQVRIAAAESRLSTLDSGSDVILVNGTVANDSGDAQGVPPIAVKVTASSGRAQRYVFGTQNRILNGGQSMDFAYRLDVPAGGVKNVEIVLSENQ